MGALPVEANSTVSTIPSPRRLRPAFNDEAYWLLGFVIVCAALIVGCACYSLRITRRRLRKSLANGKRTRRGWSLADGSSHRAEISCEVSDVSSAPSSSLVHANGASL